MIRPALDHVRKAGTANAVTTCRFHGDSSSERRIDDCFMSGDFKAFTRPRGDNDKRVAVDVNFSGKMFLVNVFFRNSRFEGALYDIIHVAEWAANIELSL